ncbi:phospholipase D-like domain-containing protein [Oceanisphaera profunda]|uniref:hypothetical protein n=1 Tax=Oceanisphaera profunda TaxID=1416627 RepID=UPI001D131962|nr:hypothetical protein [Oceanisphaera profunda]
MLIDNVTTKVTDILADSIEQGDKLSVMTGLFSIYAFNHLKASLGKVESARLLFSQAKGFDLVADDANNSPFGSLNGGKLETKFRNQLNQKAIAQEFANWLEEKAAVRLVEQAGAVHQHVTHLEQNATAIQGAQFNGQGLGLTQTSGFDMISLAKAEQALQ